MDALKNPYLIVPITAWLIAQIVKFAIPALKRERDIQWKRLVQLEGNPAAHIVSVASIIPVAWTVSGVDTAIFGIAVLLLLQSVFLFITLRHKDIDMYVQIARLSGNEVPNKRTELDTLLRSSWLSIGLGVLIGFILTINRWTGEAAWINRRPGDDESLVYLILFAAAILVGEAALVIMRRRSLRKLPTSRRLRRAIRLSVTLPAVIGIFFAFLQNQTSNVNLTQRYWTTLFLVWIPVGTIWAYLTVYKKAAELLSEERDHFNRQNRLKRPKNRKKNKRRK